MDILQDRVMTVQRLIESLHSMLSRQPDWADVPVCLVDEDGVSALAVSTEMALLTETRTGRPIVAMLRLSTSKDADHVRRMVQIATRDSENVHNNVRERFELA